MASSPEQIQQIVSAVMNRNSAKSAARTGDGAILAALLRASSGAKDPLAGSKNALDAKVAAILASNAPDSVKQNVLKQSSAVKNQESWWDKTLNVLGKPKSAVVATVGYIADPNRNWLKDVRNNIGVTGLLENQDWYRNMNAKIGGADALVKTGIGLGGDIALDPLTYIAPASAVEKIGGARGAAKLAFDASSAAKAAGNVQEAANLASVGQKASKGISTLSKAEKDIIAGLGVAAGKLEEGQKIGGLYLNVPGTGKLGQMLGIAEEAKQIPILPRGVSSIIPKSIRGGEEFTRASALGQKVGKYIGGDPVKNSFIQAIRRGLPENAADAFHALDGWQMGGARGAAYSRSMEGLRSTLVNVAKKAGVNMEDITRALKAT